MFELLNLFGINRGQPRMEADVGRGSFAQSGLKPVLLFLQMGQPIAQGSTVAPILDGGDDAYDLSLNGV